MQVNKQVNKKTEIPACLHKRTTLDVNNTHCNTHGKSLDNEGESGIVLSK